MCYLYSPIVMRDTSKLAVITSHHTCLIQSTHDLWHVQPLLHVYTGTLHFILCCTIYVYNKTNTKTPFSLTRDTLLVSVTPWHAATPDYISAARVFIGLDLYTRSKAAERVSQLRMPAPSQSVFRKTTRSMQQATNKNREATIHTAKLRRVKMDVHKALCTYIRTPPANPMLASQFI